MTSTASAPTERRTTRARPANRPHRTDGLERLRILLAGALGAVLVGYALLVPVAALLLMSGDSGSVGGAFSVAIPMWLAAHLIPVEVGGRPLGLVPLLPTIVVMLGVAAASGSSVRRLGGRLRHDAGAVVAGQAGAAATVAVLAGALLPGDVGVATPWLSVLCAGLVAGLGSAAGVLRVCGMPAAWARRVRGWPRAAVTGARAGATGLVGAGALVLLAAFAFRAGAVADSFAALGPGAGAGGGVLLLALGYLPNAVAAGTSWSLGAGVTVGATTYGPFGTVPGALPPFPLFAALPPEPPSSAAVLVLVLPLVVGAVVGRVCRNALGDSEPLRDRLAAAGAAALLTAVGVAVVTAVAGGGLAGGPYDPVSLSPTAAGAAALVLLGVPATIACARADELLGRPPARSAPVSGRARSRPGRGPRGGAASAGTPRRRVAAADRAGDGRPDRPGPARGATEADPGPEPSGPSAGARPRTVADLVAQTGRAARTGADDRPAGPRGGRGDSHGTDPDRADSDRADSDRADSERADSTEAAPDGGEPGPGRVDGGTDGAAPDATPSGPGAAG